MLYKEDDLKTTDGHLSIVIQSQFQIRIPIEAVAWRCSAIKRVLRNFAKLTGPVPESLLIKKETLAQVFSCEFCEIFRKTYFTEHLRTTASGISY